LEAGNFWFRSRNKLIIWTLKNYFSKINSFFEIGCGTGFVLSAIEKKIPDAYIYGSEIFTKGLEYASSRLSRAELFQMDACEIPFENEFDVIGAFDVLEHIKEDVLALKQIYNSLKTGGGLILTVPQHPWLWSFGDEYAHHFRRYQAKELITKAEKAGFKVVRTTSFVSLILPLMILSRLSQPKNKTNFDPFAEFKINKSLNFILEKILNFERLLIKYNINFPMGGSLLMIAKKY
jgi:SAM-dependent methyltransferase